MRSHRAVARFASLALGAVVLWAAGAEAALTCAPGRLARVGATKKALRVAGSVERVLDPTATGLVVELASEPETAADATRFRAELPAAGFTAAKGGFRYDDPAGAVAGVTRLKLKTRKGTTRLSLRAAPLALGGASPASLRLVVTDAAGCGRTCGGACKTTKKGGLKCRKSIADPLCGLESGCDLFGVAADGSARACLLPYPSDVFTREDASTETGRRIDFQLGAMPANAVGIHVDPAKYDVLDGYSPGPVALTHFPNGVDLAASNVPPATDLAASLDPASPTLFVEADAPGCVRVLHFGENDVSIDTDGMPVSSANQVFMMRPAVRLANGTRYIVAMRGLVDGAGAPIEAGPAFRTLRDDGKTKLPALEARRAHTEAIVEKLESDCGVDRSSLILAWDFTTASDDSIERYLLRMRDETFAQLPGSAAPAFLVDTVEDDPLGDPRVCRRVRGTYSVPLWTTFDGPGSVLNLDPATDLPVQNGVANDIPFTVIIPCSLMTPTPAGGRPIVYGHGLLGSGDGEVTANNLRILADTYGFVLGATDWQGFSEEDVPAILGFLGEVSGFPMLSERLHQGVLNQLVLARLMGSPAGFASHPAFQVDGTPLIDTTAVYWYGISQGGIEGGVVMALAQDVTRGVLGVPAANYSTLLHRSVDFAPFFGLLKAQYPDAVDRALLLSLIQQLWDRSEPNGWYHHTIPGSLPDTPAHRVLVHMARSDAEVANLGTTIMVRSMGIPQLAPVSESFYGIAEMAAPLGGSAFVESDFGLPAPPVTNVPPPANGVHGEMRKLVAIQRQIDQFLRPDGTVQQFCSGPCDPD